MAHSFTVVLTPDDSRRVADALMGSIERDALDGTPGKTLLRGELGRISTGINLVVEAAPRRTLADWINARVDSRVDQRVSEAIQLLAAADGDH